LTILQKYIFREWLLTMLAVSFVLVFVFMGVFLGELLNDMADGRMPPGILGTQMLLHMPVVLGNIVPLAGFVAIIWGLGRLYRDHEMVVMRSSGFGWRQLLRPLLTLMLPVAAVLLVMTVYFGPRAAVLSDQALDRALKSATLWGLQPGRFQSLQGGRLVIYVEELDIEGRRLRNVFLQRKEDDGRVRIWQADSGEYWLDEETGHRFLKLSNGQVTDGFPDRRDLRVLSFERNDVMLPEPVRTREEERPETRRSGDLLFAGDTQSSAELQWRLAPPLALIVLSLLAIPLAHSDPREGRGSRVVLGILAYAVYANSLYLCRAWIEGGSLPAYLGLWWIHALVLLTALLWLQRQGRVVGRA
jgi:lipopolysaccharide export system permease protein